MRYILILLVIYALTTQCYIFADEIKFNDGKSLKCIIIQENEDKITFLFNQNLFRIDRSNIETIKDSSTHANSTSGVELIKRRIPDYKTIMIKIGSQRWASNIKKIPATVIDAGIFQKIPYKSHHAGDVFEINVYGDPIEPVGFEIGFPSPLSNESKAKNRCIDFVCDLLSDTNDIDAIRKMNLEKDLVICNGLTFEITPPTDADAYGCWWISIYCENKLKSVRATDIDIKSISVAKSSITNTSKSTLKNENINTIKSDELDVSEQIESQKDWSSDDLSYARKSKNESYTKNSSGLVYVKGYYRKDGTYVNSYTRSAPHHKK